MPGEVSTRAGWPGRLTSLPRRQAASVTGAKAWASCDDGQTWRRATVSSVGRGQFRLHFSVPSGCQVTLRVSAADAAGGSIAETITRAYATSG